MVRVTDETLLTAELPQKKKPFNCRIEILYREMSDKCKKIEKQRYHKKERKDNIIYITREID